MTRRLIFLISAALVLGLALVAPALASPASSPRVQPSRFHPDFPLLDADGGNVLVSGGPVSAMRSCGDCHDTAFIAEHSGHADAGLTDLGAAAARPWDLGPGLLGRWNPIVYRTLGGDGDSFDLGLPGWIQTYGARHVGGGPAIVAPDGTPLEQLDPDAGHLATGALDSNGEVVAWDWSASGVVEMNCFLCHLETPDNQARLEALRQGDFAWASTATLLQTGVVARGTEGFAWSAEAFDAAGNVRAASLGVQDPSDQNCGLCHGLIHDNLQEPLSVTGCSAERHRTVTTGQIYSGQRLADSGMNLASKETLTRPWDVHAERLLTCTDCHYSLNNPVYVRQSEQALPEHLAFDPRRLELGEFLERPLHDFAQGGSSTEPASMRTCEACHNTETTHDWLPYRAHHFEALACETCHIPRLYSNALQTIDWTVLTAEGNPLATCRGLEGDPDSVAVLIAGFEPAILPRPTVDGSLRLAPFNLVTAWFWVYGDPPRPVRQIDLQAAWFDGAGYAAEVVAAFDADADGSLSDAELALDTSEKQALIAGRLAALGLEDPRVFGEVQPFSIHHDVAPADWAVSDCQTCHADDSALARTVRLSNSAPGSAAPAFVADSPAAVSGEILSTDGGAVLYQPDPSAEGLYVFGRDSVAWVDRLGGLAFVGVLLGVTVHAGLRVVARRGRPHAVAEGEPVYLYGMYERLWHWLQTFTVAGLLFTGLIIHRPETFAVFSFPQAVLAHNILAVILALNAGLSLFYHLASGEIRQYLPRPAGFFHQAILLARFYLRGIFRGEPHPFHKDPQRKLNPLQQITYLAILNVLLPLQGITGVLMWGVQHWPQAAAWLGGLPFLAPLHTLLAWLFAAFIALHVYLTTTGPSPLTSLKAMTLGWELVETPEPARGGST